MLPPIKTYSKHEESSQHAIIPLKSVEQNNKGLMQGLQIVGKNYVTIMQWAGKFGEVQYQHQFQAQLNEQYKQHQKASKFNIVGRVNENLRNLVLLTCPLCLVQKAQDQMLSIAGCAHRFCYSCLNSYVISRIQDLMIVVCPHPTCGKTLTMHNKVYRYLPDQIKVKFLSNKNLFRYSKEQEQKRCPRCLQQKHPGQCKMALKPQTVQQSFKFRVCKKCKTQASVTQGKKKIVCRTCKNQFCYLCGNNWQPKGSHRCDNQQKIKQMEVQFKAQLPCTCCQCTSCCECCDKIECCDCNECQQCCNGCIDCCDCEKCLEHCCDCNDFGPFKCLIGTIMFPLRIISVLVYAAIASNFIIMMLIAVFLWAVLMLFMSAFCGICTFASQNDDISCAILVLMIVFYPISIIYFWINSMYKGKQFVQSLLIQPTKSQYAYILQIWVCTSPQKCC